MSTNEIGQFWNMSVYLKKKKTFQKKGWENISETTFNLINRVLNRIYMDACTERCVSTHKYHHTKFTAHNYIIGIEIEKINVSSLGSIRHV